MHHPGVINNTGALGVNNTGASAGAGDIPSQNTHPISRKEQVAQLTQASLSSVRCAPSSHHCIDTTRTPGMDHVSLVERLHSSVLGVLKHPRYPCLVCSFEHIHTKSLCLLFSLVLITVNHQSPIYCRQKLLANNNRPQTHTKIHALLVTFGYFRKKAFAVFLGLSTLYTVH
jgi:hypothetical protein